ncbi:MAG TPA: cyclic nucleotide-binding domain-containing protein [Acidimicrobiales bacterium]|nr:cyclic nucleotide-binding domain-containing protein [Acidimicrobiales bacterium]
MRVESSVTSISWIPSEAVSGILMKLPFEWGLAHYDEPPPDVLGDVDELRKADRFRFANVLRAWIEVDDGRITSCGQAGEGQIGATTLRVGSRQATFQAIALPDLSPEPIVTDDAVTFTQTAGGRTGVPAPRRVRRAPFVQFSAPLAWTTLSLTIRVDGTSEHDLTGASPFPRHWLYGSSGQLEKKSGLIDFTDWSKNAFGRHSPWGDSDSAALSTAVETALERELSVILMQGDVAPLIRKVRAGGVITEQGEEGSDLFLILDGVVGVEVDGESLAELGPGALLGERAILEGGVRTATLRAITKCKLAVVPGDRIDPAVLPELSKGHRREEEQK